MAVLELFLTALVVAVICLLFLGRLNTAISVILAVPIALAASPILYTLLGFTFNLVSLLAAPVLVQYEIKGMNLGLILAGVVCALVIAASVVYSKRGGFKKSAETGF